MLIAKIDKLNKTLQKKDELIEKLLEERDKYKNHSNKNSSNSYKSLSTDIVKQKNQVQIYVILDVRLTLRLEGRKNMKVMDLLKKKLKILMQKMILKK